MTRIHSGLLACAQLPPIQAKRPRIMHQRRGSPTRVQSQRFVATENSEAYNIDTTSEATMAVETKTRKKKGLFSRFRKKKDKKEMTEKVEEPTPPPSPEPQEDNPHKSKSKTKKSVTKEGIPVITADNPDDFRASDVQKTIPGQPAVTKSKKKRGPRPGSVILDKAPTAREAAFSGPPRYDWIDIVRTFLFAVSSAIAIAFPCVHPCRAVTAKSWLASVGTVENIRSRKY